MAAIHTLLLLESDPVQLSTLRMGLERAQYKVVSALLPHKALQLAEHESFDLILVNLDMVGSEGNALLKKLTEMPNHAEVVVYTAKGSIAHAVEAMRAGAYDFLIMPVAHERLLATLKNACEHKQLTRTVQHYQQQQRAGFHGFVGSSVVMQGVYRLIEQAASSKATVFITGESGTGKEVAAHAVHQLSPRAKAPFIALNCAALPKDLIESEIFGHVKGAFTGATDNRDGAARQAHGGTLFLDEICEMDLNLQSKLLRFVQTGTFQPVGGSRVETVDVRLVCATNRDPLVEAEKGRFREDLYYRLHVLPVALPPLREREGDVLLIASHLLHLFSAEEKKHFTSFSPEVEGMLTHYDWPGNVRQLQNVIRNIVVMHDAEVVERAMVPPPVGGRWARPFGFGHKPAEDTISASLSLLRQATAGQALSAIRPLLDIEREAIENAITLCEGNVPKAAALLGVSPSTLYRKRQSWG